MRAGIRRQKNVDVNMGSTMVEQLTHKPKIQGLNPRREYMAEKEGDGNNCGYILNLHFVA